MPKRIIVIGAVSAALMAAAAFAWSYIGTAPRPVPSADKVTLGLSWIHEAQYAGEYYADQNGLYRANGLEVSMVPYDGGDLVEKLVSGAYDFAILQGDALLKARAQDKPVVGVFVTYRVSPTVYFARPEAGIDSLDDFKGKKVGVAYSERIPLLSMLENAGVDPATVEIIDREYSYGPLADGTYDVEAGWVTDAESVEAAGVSGARVFRAADFGANIFADVIAVSEKTLAERPDLVRRFVDATVRGWEEALKDSDAAALLTLKYDAQADPEHLKFVMAVSRPLIKPIAGAGVGLSSYVEWQRMHDIMYAQGLLDGDIDVSKAYDVSFLK